MLLKIPPRLYRQKFLLGFLSFFKNPFHFKDLKNILFLYIQKTNPQKPFYSFFPSLEGPLSFELESDLKKLASSSFITLKENNVEFSKEVDGLSYLKPKDISLLKEFFKNPAFNNLKKTQEMLLVPPYASYTLKNVKDNLEKSFFTLGYEKKSIDQYLNLLITNKIQGVVDVRNNPFSMKFEFSKSRLKAFLNRVAIDYIHLPQLGIESKKRKGVLSPQDYQKLFDIYEKEVLLNQKKALLTILNWYDKKKRIALTCFEKESHFCHRRRITNWFFAHHGILVQDL